MAATNSDAASLISPHFLGAMGPFHLRWILNSAGLSALSRTINHARDLDRNGKRELDGEPPAKKLRASEESERDKAIPVARYECDVAISIEDGEPKVAAEFVDSLQDSQNIPLAVEWTEATDESDGSLLTLTLKDEKNLRRKIGMLWDQDIGNSKLFPQREEFLNAPMEVIKDFQKTQRLPFGPGQTAPTKVVTLLGPSQLSDHLRISIELQWVNGQSLALSPRQTLEQIEPLFSACFNGSTLGQREHWIPRDFYDSAHVPLNNVEIWPEIAKADMEGKLFPFQQRTVQYMLQREGASLKGGKIVTRLARQAGDYNRSLYTKQHDMDGNDVYVSSVFGGVIRNPIEPAESVKGGILSEEMGLGKTVELIALLMLHRREIYSPTMMYPLEDGSQFRSIRVSGSTLIITPSHLISQWRDELAFHAPRLSVFIYNGVKSHKGVDLVDYDVVLTTYMVLAKDFHYVLETNPGRDLRNAKRFVPPKSPVSGISWWRICLDEAQMVDSGTSQAARVAMNIPRINSWAVSGTPFKKHVEDLGGLLKFLHCAPFDDPRFWNRIDKAAFKDLFSKVAVRHTKARVRHEIDLPRQERMVVSIPFTVFEEQQYRDLFQKMCADCGFDSQGNPIDDREQDVETLSLWLRRLRQMCLHIGVGKFNRKALAGSGPLRTLEEVLESAIAVLVTNIRAARRTKIQSMIKQGHVHAFNNADLKRAETSYSFYHHGLEQAIELVKECRVDTLEAKEAETTHPRYDEASKKISGLSHELRSALEVEHLCRFYVATARFQMGEVLELSSELKDEYHAQELAEYAKAKEIRQELLSENRHAAEELMKRVSQLELKGLPEAEISDDYVNPDTAVQMERLTKVYRVLNRQKDLLNEWRVRAKEVLLKPLVDTEKDGIEDTGEEYERSTKDQDILYSLFDVLRAICAERTRILTGKANTLVEHEIRGSLIRANNEYEALGDDGGEGSKLFMDLMEAWADARPSKSVAMDSVVSRREALRSKQIDLSREFEQRRSGTVDRLATDRHRVRLGVIRELASAITRTYDAQKEALASLEKDIDLFRQCMNQRLEYYRRLQAISDTVQLYKDTPDEVLDVIKLRQEESQEAKAQKQIADFEDRHRFYRNQQKHTTESAACPICMDPYEHGVLTPCGHQVCKDCSISWFPQSVSVQGHCPVCRFKFKIDSLQNIFFKPEIVEAENDQTITDLDSSPSKNDAIYSEISATTLDEIKTVDLPISYGTKVDWLARLVIWLRRKEPGVQVVVCSQFREFLETLAIAFTKFGIRYGDMSKPKDGPGGINEFRHNNLVTCLLLDVKSNSSGLNLVKATHIILCEPMVNAALELQVIARVHRIGQMKATTVWMTLIAGTVEHAVYNLSVGRRQEHLAQRKAEAEKSAAVAAGFSDEAELEAADSLTMEAAPAETLLGKVKGFEGEVVQHKDLWTCLFGKTLQQPGMDSVEMGRLLRATAADERGLQNGDV